MSFSNDLKKWRGNRRQKEVHELFGISLACYQAWEQGVNVPTALALEQARWRMAAVDAGVSVEFYRARYLQVIKQVATEIQNKK